MKEKIKKLVATVNDDEQAEIKIYQQARKTKLDDYEKNPTAAIKKDLDAATEGLRRLVDSLWAKYFVTEKVYKNRLELVEALEKDGYAVKKSKLYQDSKRLPSKGGLHVESDGSIRQSSIEAWLAHPQGGGKIAAKKGLADESDREEVDAALGEKLQLEVKILRTKEQRERLSFEREQGKWLPRDDFQMELAGRAGVLDVGLDYHFNLEADHLIEMVAGKQEFRGMLIQALVEMKNKALTEFCSVDTYQVMFIDEGEKEEAGTQ